MLVTPMVGAIFRSMSAVNCTGLPVDFLALGSFQVRLSPENLNVRYHSESSLDSYNVGLPESFYHCIGLLSYREALVSEIGAAISRYGNGALHCRTM